MLAFSLSGILIFSLGISIEKVSLFGTEFLITSFQSIPTILGLIILYYFMAFLINGLEEYSSAYRANRDAYVGRIIAGQAYSLHDLNDHLQTLQSEIQELENESRQLFAGGTAPELRDRITEKREQIARVTRAREIAQSFQGSFFTRLRLGTLKITMNLFLPLLIAFWSLVQLFFFTDIPQIKPVMNQTFERQIEKNSEQTMDSAIPAPQRKLQADSSGK